MLHALFPSLLNNHFHTQSRWSKIPLPRFSCSISTFHKTPFPPFTLIPRTLGKARSFSSFKIWVFALLVLGVAAFCWDPEKHRNGKQMEESEGGSGSQPVHVRSQNLRRRLAAVHGGFREVVGRCPSLAGELGHGFFQANHAGDFLPRFEALQKCQQILQGFCAVSLWFIHLLLLWNDTSLSLSPSLLLISFALFACKN